MRHDSTEWDTSEKDFNQFDDDADKTNLKVSR